MVERTKGKTAIKFPHIDKFVENTNLELYRLNDILAEESLDEVVKQKRFDSSIENILVELFSKIPLLVDAKRYIENVFSLVYAG
jgi:hypothetical protein